LKHKENLIFLSLLLIVFRAGKLGNRRNI